MIEQDQRDNFSNNSRNFVNIEEKEVLDLTEFINKANPSMDELSEYLDVSEYYTGEITDVFRDDRFEEDEQARQTAPNLGGDNDIKNQAKGPSRDLKRA